MNLRRIVIKVQMGCLVACLTLAACGIKTGGLTPTQEITPNTPVPTEPTSTTIESGPTETSTPTETQPPTPETPSEEFLKTLELIPDREYVVQGDKYVETYNNSVWAIRENGVWRITTAEEKYGFMAPNNPDSYQNPNSWLNGDDYHSGDSNYKSQDLFPVWTGDVVERQVMDQGVQINEVDGIFVMRDLNGELVQLKVRLHSPDVKGEFRLYVKTQVSVNSTQTGPKVGEPADLLPVGEQIEVQIYYQVPQSAIQSSRCAPNGSCTDEYNAGMRQFWAQETETQAFIDSLRIMKNIPEDSDLVLVPRMIVVKK